jgi:hypothetical protein
VAKISQLTGRAHMAKGRYKSGKRTVARNNHRMRKGTKKR